MKVLASQLCLTAIPWTAAHQAPLSMAFSKQGYWSGLPFPSPVDLPNQGLNPGLLNCRQILYRLSYQGSPTYSYQEYIFHSRHSINTHLYLRRLKYKSLLVQWLKFITPNEGGPGLIPDLGTRAHVKLKILEAAMKIKDPTNLN